MLHLAVQVLVSVVASDTDLGDLFEETFVQ